MADAPLGAPRPPQTLVDLLCWRGADRPDGRAYTFLDDDDTRQALSYAALDRRARAIAARLQAHGLAGQRALLLYPPGPDYLAAFWGCLYAGVVAVPTYPPSPARPERTLPRLRAALADAEPALALTTSALAGASELLAAHDPRFGRLRWERSDRIPDAEAAAWRPPGLRPQHLAMLQYTSGSTSAPRGVMLSHANLLDNCAAIYRRFGHTPESRGVIWLPPYHDMGLIGGMIQPVYGGFPVTLLAPAAFLQRPLRWLETIARERASVSGGPNFAYELCVRKTTPAQRAGLDLACWQVAFCGAEPVGPETLERFAQAFGPCGFRREALLPCYGLAEATLMVSGAAAGAGPLVRSFDARALAEHRAEAQAGPDGPRALVGCGAPAPGAQVAVVHPQRLTRCGPGQVGELWVAGPSVAQGYWGRPEESERVFGAGLADAPGLRFLRTGDLGFVQDGQVFVTGRLKDVVIIRGRNHYPQDLELTAEQSHPAIRPGHGAAFGVTLDGQERLVIVYEVERQHRRLAVAPIADAIRRAVAARHELAVYAVVLLAPGGVPKTTSGKIQRAACRRAFLEGTLREQGRSLLADPPAGADLPDDPAAPPDLRGLEPQRRRAALRALLREALAQTLHIAPEQLDGARPLEGLGVDSIGAIELQHHLERRLGLGLPLSHLLEARSLDDLADALLAGLERAAAPAAPPPQTPAAPGEVPLTVGQRAMWFLHQIAPDNAAYLLSEAVRLRGELDVAALERAFQTLVDRHPALRVRFVERAGGPVQLLAPAAPAAFSYQDAGGWSQAQLDAFLAAEARRPLDLARGPLLRVHVLRRAPDEHCLLLAIHHIISDGWSMALLVHELGVIYAALRGGRPLEPAPPDARYAEVLGRQERLLAGPEGQRLWELWRARLADAPGALDLPTDRVRPSTPSYRGAAQPLSLPAGPTARLKALAAGAGATLFMVALAALQTLLHRYTGQTDILVGSPVAGRAGADSADMIGYFTNPAVLRARLDPHMRFDQLLAQARQRVLEALDHQGYPFALLDERLAGQRPQGTPLFRVMLVFQRPQLLYQEGLTAFALRRAGARLRVGGLDMEALELPQQTAQFDLTLVLAEVEGRLEGLLQYSTDLFEAPTAARMAGHLETLLAGAAADPRRRLADLPLLSAAERAALGRWGAGARLEPSAACIHELTARQSARSPAATALIDGAERISYAELEQRANRLAWVLRDLGVGPEVLVGVCMRRSAALVVALLAVLKAGGGYVPLDPAYPPARRALMLEDSRAALVLADGPGEGQGGARWLRLDELAGRLERAALHAPPGGACADNLAYVIYTSGSTGRPKGVAIAHRSAVVLLEWARATFGPELLAGVLAATSVCFDLSVFELFAPLCWGGTLILAENALALPALPAADAVRLVNTVPSLMAELLRQGDLPAGVRAVALAGEPLPRALAQACYRQPGVTQVFNLYGPSEDTTYSTAALLAPGEAGPPTIGGPLPNTQAYVLDAGLRPVPAGVPGELYLSGDGLARGYLGRPDLTAERFVPNPFGDDQGRATQDEAAGARDDQRRATEDEAAGARDDQPRTTEDEAAGARDDQSRTTQDEAAGARDDQPRTTQDEAAGARDDQRQATEDEAAGARECSGTPTLYRSTALPLSRSPALPLSRSPALPLSRSPALPLSRSGGRLYKTGDLARWRADGQIEFLGRRDHQIKLRGFRIELGEIEHALAQHPAVAECAVLAREDRPGDPQLVAYIVPAAEVPAAEDDAAAPPPHPLTRSPLHRSVAAWLRERLPQHMVPAAFVLLAELPRSPNGKLERRALPAPDWGAGGPQADAEPRGELERRLAAIWAAVLERERVGVHDDFFALGGHSLKAMRLVARLRAELAVDLPVRRLFELGSVAALAAQIERQGAGAARPPADEPELAALARPGQALPLSFAQQRLWVLSQIEAGGLAYSLPAAVQIEGPLRAEALERSLAEVVRRHAVLRSTFHSADGAPYQRIAPPEQAGLALARADLSALEPEVRRRRVAELVAAAVREPFDLERGPLLRAALLRQGQDAHLLLLVLHHIAADGWSVGVLTRELTALYETYDTWRTGGPGLPAPPLQYADYALWQRAWLQGPRRDALLAYWGRQLAGLPALRLPLDRERLPAAAAPCGAQPLRLPAALAEQLRALGRAEGASLFMVLLAGLAALLGWYSGQDDIPIGTDVAGRPRPELEGLIGFFVNMLVLRLDLRGGPSFRALLGRSRDTCLDAYAHQDLPFEQVVELLQPPRDPGSTPLFQVVLVLQNTPAPAPAAAGVRLRGLPLDDQEAKFDLVLNLAETPDGLEGLLKYRADRFEPASAERMAALYQALLEQAAAQPEADLAALLEQAEQRRRQARSDSLAELRRQTFRRGRRQALGGAPPAPDTPAE